MQASTSLAHKKFRYAAIPQRAARISLLNMCAEPPKMALITSSLANTLTTLFALHKAGAFITAHSMSFGLKETGQQQHPI